MYNKDENSVSFENKEIHPKKNLPSVT